MIHHGDLFDVLPTLPENSVDACVTDPPYGIGFMGKTWDTFKPEVTRDVRARTLKNHKAAANPNLKGRLQWSGGAPVEYDYSVPALKGFQDWTARWASEVFRVLKPGAYLLVCAAPRSYHRMACGLEDAGFEIRDEITWLFGSGFPKSKDLGDGKGTALKPAHEPIALAWKPFKGTISACHHKHGTAALYIEDCRIGDDPAGWGGGALHGLGKNGDPNPAIGRWPANVALDEYAAALLDEQTGILTSGANPTSRGSDKFRDIYGEFKGQAECNQLRGAEEGGASRFYYVAKPSREERDYGTQGLHARQRDESRKEGNPGGDNPRNRGLQPRGNFHPTVKPVELMRWLVRLVTPPNGVVLDPFTGSGTTGMACRYEQRQFIGVEREAEYLAIAERRIAAVAPLFGETA